MFNNLFGMGDLSDLGLLSAMIVVIVQLIKQIIPKKVPTQLVTLIVGIMLSCFLILPNFDFSLVVLFKSILIGFLSAFVAMNGFDSLNEIWQRFNKVTEEKEQGDENEQL